MKDPQFRRTYRKRIFYNVNLDAPDDITARRLDFSPSTMARSTPEPQRVREIRTENQMPNRSGEQDPYNSPSESELNELRDRVHEPL